MDLFLRLPVSSYGYSSFLEGDYARICGPLVHCLSAVERDRAVTMAVFNNAPKEVVLRRIYTSARPILRGHRAVSGSPEHCRAGHHSSKSLAHQHLLRHRHRPVKMCYDQVVVFYCGCRRKQLQFCSTRDQRYPRDPCPRYGSPNRRNPDAKFPHFCCSSACCQELQQAARGRTVACEHRAHEFKNKRFWRSKDDDRLAAMVAEARRLQDEEDAIKERHETCEPALARMFTLMPNPLERVT